MPENNIMDREWNKEGERRERESMDVPENNLMENQVKTTKKEDGKRRKESARTEREGERRGETTKLEGTRKRKSGTTKREK